MKMQDIIGSGQLEGYREHYNQIDSDVCEEDSKCDNCGHDGLRYYGFTKDNSYRAFAVCPECEEANEF